MDWFRALGFSGLFVTFGSTSVIINIICVYKILIPHFTRHFRG